MNLLIKKKDISDIVVETISDISDLLFFSSLVVELFILTRRTLSEIKTK